MANKFKSDKEMVLVFTSFRDSIVMDGLKVALDRHTPKLCSYTVAEFMTMPYSRRLSNESMAQICEMMVVDNWELIKDFVEEIYGLGIYRIVFCDWATEEQIKNGRFCGAGIIGKYIMDRADEFGFGIRIEMEDGREGL